MKTYFLFLFFFVSAGSYAQNDTTFLKKNIKAGMDSLSESFEKKDWPTFTHFMHPALIKMLGGEKNFISFIEQQMNALNDAKINSMGAGNVLQLINYKNQWQCVVESYLQMTIDSITVSTVSSNVGVTYDKGKTWKFIRVTDGNETQVKKLFPDISPSIQIPYNKTSYGVTIEELLKTYQPKYPPAKD